MKAADSLPGGFARDWDEDARTRRCSEQPGAIVGRSQARVELPAPHAQSDSSAELGIVTSARKQRMKEFVCSCLLLSL